MSGVVRETVPRLRLDQAQYCKLNRLGAGRIYGHQRLGGIGSCLSVAWRLCSGRWFPFKMQFSRSRISQGIAGPMEVILISIATTSEPDLFGWSVRLSEKPQSKLDCFLKFRDRAHSLGSCILTGSTILPLDTIELHQI